MSVRNPGSDVFDHDAGFTRRRCRLDPSRDPGLFAHFSKAMPDGRYGSRFLICDRQQSVGRILPHAREARCPLLARGLSHSCLLKETI